MMQEQDLRELSELVSEEAPVLSLYLNLDRHNRSMDEYKLQVRKLLAEGVEQGAAPADVERIERFFEHEYDRQGKAVACFSCQSPRFWRSYSLLVPVRSAVFVGHRPLVKPLMDVWDNYDRFSVITVDREGARIFVYHLGELEDTAGVLGEEVKRHKQGGWAAQKLQRYEDQEARHNLKEAAEWANNYLTQQKVTRVVLSGSDGNLAEFRDQLPRSLLDKVIGNISLDMNCTPTEAWDHAFEVAQQAQQQEEADLLSQVITAARKGGAGTTGLADTLAALQQGRVYQLLVDPALHQPGRQCVNCKAVLIYDVDVCPYCEGKMVASADVVNLAVHSAMDAGLKVSALEADPQLTEVGGIAAVLRY
jgi:peptide chain release factor subunit 1